MRYPNNLPESGSLGFIAPSFGCAVEPYRSAFQNGLKRFHEMGFQTVLGPNAFSGQGVGISSTPESCGREVNDFFSRDDVDAIISCGGGELMCTILDFVDFDLLRKKNPKWFMGFSDNTILTFLLPTLCDTAAIYGPCAPAFGMEPWHPVLWDALHLLRGVSNRIQGYGHFQLEGGKDEDHPLLPYNTTGQTVLKFYPEDSGDIRIRGRLLGGCLDVLSNLSGTVYDQVNPFIDRYREDGILWFLEACDLNVFDIRRSLWKLDQSGWFRSARGFLIGRPLHYHQDMMGLDQYRAVTDSIGKYGVPIIMDADLGHLPPSMPILCGAIGELHARGNALSLRFLRG